MSKMDLVRYTLWAVVVYCLITCLGLVGCGGGSSADDSNPSSFQGIGLSRHWHTQDPKEYAATIAASGANLTTIEWNPCAISSKRSCKRTSDEWCSHPAQASDLVNALRDQGVSTLINLINANGCTEQHLPDADFEAALNQVVEMGTEGVWLSAVSEPWTGDKKKWHAWTLLARSRWTGTFVLPANSGAGKDFNPAWPGIAADYIDFHPCSVPLAEKGLMQPGVLVNTDCTGMFLTNPATATHLVALSRNTGNPLVLYGWIHDTTLPGGILAAFTAP